MKILLCLLLLVFTSLSFGAAHSISDTVNSVNGYVGAVTLAKADVGLSGAVEAIYSTVTVTQDYAQNDTLALGITLPADARLISVAMSQEGVDCSISGVNFSVAGDTNLVGTQFPAGAGAGGIVTSSLLQKHSVAKAVFLTFTSATFGCSDDVEKIHTIVQYVQE